MISKERGAGVGMAETGQMRDEAVKERALLGGEWELSLTT